MPRKNYDWDNVPGFNRETEEYIRLDLDTWLVDQGIVEAAKRQGAQNEPSIHVGALDGAESKILAWVNRRGRTCRDNVSRHLTDLVRNLSDMENGEVLAILEQQVNQVSKNAEIELELGIRQGRNALQSKESDVRDGTRDFEEFRRRSGLTRLADYSHRPTAMRWVVGCLIIEIILNAAMLMEVNAFGLVGSAVQMGLIGAINVLIAGLCMGELLRQRNHVTLKRRVLSWLGIVPLGFFIALFNLAVGHFRDSMQAVLNDPTADIFSLGNDALQRFYEGVFALDSFQSALLALLGFLFFCVASWKWLQRDDPYPEYGRRERQLRAKEQAYRQLYDQLQSELHVTFKDFESKLEDIRHKLVIKQTAWRETCTRGSQLVSNYAINLEQYQLDLDFLLNAYRTANRSARTEAEPPHFAKREFVDESILDPPKFNPPGERSLKGVADRVDLAIAGLQDTFRQSMREYRTLEEVKSA